MPDDLTDDERDVLAFEGLWWRRRGGKEAALLERFGLTPTEHYRQLNLPVSSSTPRWCRSSSRRRLRKRP